MRLRCSTCREDKPRTEFYADRNAPARDGYSYRCKACMRQAHRESRARLRDKPQVTRTKLQPYQPRLDDDWRRRWFLMTGNKPK